MQALTREIKEWCTWRARFPGHHELVRADLAEVAAPRRAARESVSASPLSVQAELRVLRPTGAERWGCSAGRDQIITPPPSVLDAFEAAMDSKTARRH
jgi:hypothetical protein